MEEFAFGFWTLPEGMEFEGWEEYYHYAEPDSGPYTQENFDGAESST